MHSCPVCGDVFTYEVDTGTAKPPFPSDWYLFVVHEHHPEPRPGTWRACLFHRSKGGRYPKEAKLIAGLQKENRKTDKVARQVANASSGQKEKGRIG